MPENVVYLLRIVLAIVLGCAIGIERKIRFKEAGMRTHAIVSAGAAIFIVVSKYGFADSGSFDASRIAAQIVSGIGFLGAGIIMYKRNIVHNLTTAAGIWATSGIGMAAGAGLYFVAIGAAFLIIVTQCFMHLNIGLLKTKRYTQLKIVFFYSETAFEKIKSLFEVRTLKKVNVTKEGEEIKYSVVISTDKNYDTEFFYKAMSENDFVISIDSSEDE